MVGAPRRTHCFKGHELTDDNLRVSLNRLGRPQRMCKKMTSAIKYKKDKEK